MSHNIKNVGLASWSKCPTEPLLFCGGTISPENQQSLNIYRFDPMNKKNNAQLVGKFNTFVSVNCISWEENEHYQMGLITLGLSDGSLIVLNPKRIIEYHLEGEEAKEDCLISSFELYEN